MFKKSTIYIVLALLCLNFPIVAIAQSNPTQPLRVGDKVPESFWTSNHLFYEKGDTLNNTLMASKSKLIVLDFWATWCGSCIKKFPDLEEIQEKFGSDVSVILVNAKKDGDNFEKINKRFKDKSHPSIKYSLPTIYQDSLLSSLFPHRTIPHTVWIIEGYIRAITSSEFVDTENVEKLFERNNRVKSSPYYRKKL